MTKQLKPRTKGWGYTYLVNDVDRLWFDEGMREGWRLPAPASKFWRAWGVRHLRGIVMAANIWKWDRRWAALGLIRNGYDSWVMYAVKRGWA